MHLHGYLLRTTYGLYYVKKDSHRPLKCLNVSLLSLNVNTLSIIQLSKSHVTQSWGTSVKEQPAIGEGFSRLSGCQQCCFRAGVSVHSFNMFRYRYECPPGCLYTSGKVIGTGHYDMVSITKQTKNVWTVIDCSFFLSHAKLVAQCQNQNSKSKCITKVHCSCRHWIGCVEM